VPWPGQPTLAVISALLACGLASGLPGSGCSPSNGTTSAPTAPQQVTAARSQSPALAGDAGAVPVSPPPATASWTTFRGSPGRTGHAVVAGPRRADLAWVFRTEGRIYADACLAPDGTIYVASLDGRLYAVGPDGRERWSYDTGGKIWTSPAVAKDGTVYVGSDNDRLVALWPDGRERWIFPTAPPPPAKGPRPEAGRYDVDTSPLVLPDGTVVFGCHNFLYALHPAGGLRWAFEAGLERAKIFSSPAMGPDGTIYFGTQGSFFFALNQSAAVLWSAETGGDNDGAPAVGDDGTVYFGSDDGKLRAMAPGGAPRWVADLGAPIRAPLAIAADGTILVPTYGARPFLAALEPREGRELWRFHTEPGEGDFHGIQSGPLVDAEGYVYFGGRDHFVYCLSPRGELVWRHRTGDQVDSGPVLGPDGMLYVGSDDRRLYAFRR